MKLRIILLATMTMAAVLALVGAGTLALFSSEATSTNSTFASGKVDIAVAPATALFAVSAMAPGDSVYKELTVSNGGTLDLRYAVEAAASNPDGKALRGQLDLTVKSGVATCDATGFSGGTVVYGPGDLGGDPALKLVGDKATGAQSGDRALASGANEKLCFLLALPLATPNDFEEASTEATFTFYAEQTANNP